MLGSDLPKEAHEREKSTGVPFEALELDTDLIKQIFISKLKQYILI